MSSVPRRLSPIALPPPSLHKCPECEKFSVVCGLCMQYYDQAVKFRGVVLGMSKKYHAHLGQLNKQLLQQKAAAEEAVVRYEYTNVSLSVARAEVRDLKKRLDE